MRSAIELQVLSNWCHARSFRWLPVGGTGAPGMVLEPAAARIPWQRVRLVADPDGWRLEDELGETLATASGLPALLDAVDGGVAAGPCRPTIRPRPGLATSTAVS
jgi:hypothetical protein